jgi:hypothetical protein
MALMRISLAGALLAAIAGCAQMEQAADGLAPTGGDACGAADRQALVGTSVGTLDPATLPEGHRVIFPGQPVTMDFREERLNVEIGSDDNVARVFCG